MGVFAFLTVGLPLLFCQNSSESEPSFQYVLDQFDHVSKPYADSVKVYGYYYDFDSIKALLQTRGSINLTSDWYNQDISRLFEPSEDACAFVWPEYVCSIPNQFPKSPPLQPPAGSPCPSISWLSGISPVAIAAFSWDDVIWNSDLSLTVFNGIVLNITQEMRNNTLKSFVSQRTWQNIADSVKHDSTLAMMGSYESVQAAKCLLQTYTAGFIHAETMGCAVTHTLQWILVCCVVCIVAVKVLFAQYHNVTSFFPGYKRRRFKPKPENGRERSGNIGALDSDTPYVILFVTCYSEGLESITSTLNSLATATYPTAKKLLFVVVDGVVKGAGNDSPTADIILGLMTFPPANDVFEHDEIHSPPLRSYLAVAQGNKQHNMAKVFAGHYVTDSGADLPMVLVIKCGTPAENESTAKCIPGNRGKRDSQLILMNFLSRILYNDRMTELDFELQLKVSSVGTDPNNYQLVLMVDADTVVASDSIRHMVEAMVADESIMVIIPATLPLLLYLIASGLKYGNFNMLPIYILSSVLFLPGTLIAVTTLQIEQLFWLIVYFASTPVWNILLPLWAFWHFDDITWGETQQNVQEDGIKANNMEINSEDFVLDAILFKKCGKLVLWSFSLLMFI
ncbi:hypothetical protein HDU83_002475 [Entophlyctis luteolus]|nr:hypothetical protein HDU83_002475 [Entophlyctis luteolus]